MLKDARSILDDATHEDINFDCFALIDVNVIGCFAWDKIRTKMNWHLRWSMALVSDQTSNLRTEIRRMNH